MPNPDHIEIVACGAKAIAKWHEENPKVRLDLDEAKLRDFNLHGANLTDANLFGVDLSRAILSRASLRGADLRDANLYGADLSRAHLRRAKIGGAYCSRAYLSEADLRWADLREADFSRANLSQATINGASLCGANLCGANLREANCRGADFREANLSGASLHKACLGRANLSKANLRGTDVREADLRGANLRDANLRAAVFRGAILSVANFGGANLCEADLSGADLRETVFHLSELCGTVFLDLDLSVAKGLETARHSGPSAVGVNTLCKSNGKVSEAFLRGCGVPDALIAFLPFLIGSQQPIHFHSCFIRSSRDDQEFAKRLCTRMRDKHLRVWHAFDEMNGERALHEPAEGAIRVCDKLLLVLSEASMQSEWIAGEMRRAMDREVEEKRHVLFPVSLAPSETVKAWRCLDPDTGEDVAREIRECHIPDFSHWRDHDVFEAEFGRLLDRLKTESRPTKATGKQ